VDFEGWEEQPIKKSPEKLESEHLIEQAGAELRAMMPWLEKKQSLYRGKL
jgi:ketol-acid reductoisomerase